MNFNVVQGDAFMNPEKNIFSIEKFEPIRGWLNSNNNNNNNRL